MINTAVSKGKSLLKQKEVVYIIRFICILAPLYYFHIFFIGVTGPGGRYYISFLHEYVDYINWLRASILHTANIIVHMFGIKSYVADIYTLRVPHRPGVIVGFTCLGYGVMSFWAAFILAQEGSWQKKLQWGLIGLGGIWFINCCRIAILMLALANKWKVNQYMDHHDMFNIVVYILIFILIYLYYKESKNDMGVDFGSERFKQTGI